MNISNATFNPREHLMTIKNRQAASDYLPVQWRLVWFREQCPEGTIFTELVHMDLDKEVESESMQWDNETRRMKSVTKHGYGVAVFKATITDGRGGSSTGYGSEKASDFGDFLEKAETKSIGRALAALGFGTQFAPELNEDQRIVDAPVETDSLDQDTQASNNGSTSSSSSLLSERQLESLIKLYESLETTYDLPTLKRLPVAEANKLQQNLTAQWRDVQSEAKRKQPATATSAKEEVPTLEQIKTLFVSTFNESGWDTYLKGQVGTKQEYSEADRKKLSANLNGRIQHMQKSAVTARK